MWRSYLYASSTGNTKITQSLFINNNAINNNGGGAIYLTLANLTINYSIFLNNSDRFIEGYKVSGYGYNYNYNYNWWGTNNPQLSSIVDDLGSIVNKWVVMNVTVNPSNTINMGDNITINIDFNHYTDSNGIFYDLNTNIPELNVDFSAINGVLSDSSATTSGGVATVNYTSTVVGVDSVTIKSGNQVSVVNITVKGSPSSVVIYVSKDGNDSNNGLTKENAVLTISKAISLVNGSGKIIILNGVYNEKNLEIRGNLTIVGEGNVVINSNGSRAFRVYYGNVNLLNLYFINGNETYNGAVIRVDSGSLVIDNCTFNKNGGENKQALIQVKTANLTLLNSIFVNNTASSTSPSYGNVYISDGKLYVDNCSFINNHNKYGALYVSGGKFNILNSKFIANTTTSSSGGNGAGIYISGSASKGSIGLIDNCTFINNTVLGATYYAGVGGAIYINGNSSVIISNSLFENNTAKDGASDFGTGGAISTSAGNTTVINSIFLNNIATSGSEIFVKPTTYFASLGIFNISYSIINNKKTNDVVTSYSTLDKVIVNNNWWGTNNPTTLIKGNNITLDSWVIMNVNSNASESLNPGDKITINVDFNHVNTTNGEIKPLTGGKLPSEFTVKLVAVGGTIAPTVINTNNGEGSAEYTVTSVSNNYVNLTVDKQNTKLNLVKKKKHTMELSMYLIVGMTTMKKF